MRLVLFKNLHLACVLSDNKLRLRLNNQQFLPGDNKVIDNTTFSFNR